MVLASNSGHGFSIAAAATDASDPGPAVNAQVGAEVSEGSSITIARPDDTGLVRFMSSMVELAVEAVDTSGNRSTATALP